MKTPPILAIAITLLLATLTACTYSTGRYDEPGLRAKIVDAETDKPIQGAIIYGFYATAEGSLGGGETIKEILRVFEVESDQNGTFEIPPWKDNWSITRGERRERFPGMAIYKDGYKVETQMLTSIRRWIPQTQVLGKPHMDGDIVDWTVAPTKLKRVASEKERYNALINSNDAYASAGDCGWEQHAKLLMAQHVAWKGWLKKNMPPEGLDSAGYPNSNRPPPEWFYNIGKKSTVDVLIRRFDDEKSNWKCGDPRILFSRNQ